MFDEFFLFSSQGSLNMWDEKTKSARKEIDDY